MPVESLRALRQSVLQFNRVGHFFNHHINSAPRFQSPLWILGMGRIRNGNLKPFPGEQNEPPSTLGDSIVSYL
jgi:hypothetical protein